AQARRDRGNLLAHRASGSQCVEPRRRSAAVQGEVVADSEEGKARLCASSVTWKSSRTRRSSSLRASGFEHAFAAHTKASGALRSAAASYIAFAASGSGAPRDFEGSI